MSYLYEEELLRILEETKRDLGLSDLEFIVESEQIFAKRETLDPKMIYVVVKYLTSSIDVNEKTQPLQILILSEQNQLNESRVIFSKIAQEYNFSVYTDNDGLYIKYQYSDPVVLSNFNQIQYGYRSILYLSVTLRVMENVVDIGVTDDDGKYHHGCIYIDDELLKPTSFAMNYNMTPNSQQLNSTYIATSVKSVSGFNVSLSFNPVGNTFVENIINTIGETRTGNESYNLKFELNGVTINKNMKLTSLDFTSTPGGFPDLRIGLMK